MNSKTVDIFCAATDLLHKVEKKMRARGNRRRNKEKRGHDLGYAKACDDFKKMLNNMFQALP